MGKAPYLGRLLAFLGEKLKLRPSQTPPKEGEVKSNGGSFRQLLIKVIEMKNSKPIIGEE